MDSEWGRIDDEGRVFLRTAEGEREIGSWQAGTPDEGLAFYRKRYDDLAADIALLEGRAGSAAADPKAVAAAADRLRDSLPTAAVIGDVSALGARLAAVHARLDERRVAAAAERARASEAAADSKRALVAEAERLSTSTDWRGAGDRYRAMVEEWKAIRGVDRKLDSQLWESFAAARRRFDSSRRAHFAQRQQQRAEAVELKEQLAREAEKLAESAEWAATAKRLRELMAQWKAAGRAPREVEESLWQRFKAAQDRFFTRRSETFAARDSELAANLEAKLALVAEVEAMDAAADPDAARRRLKSVHDRWEKVGHVPRDKVTMLEERLGAAERRIREAAVVGRQVTVTESPLVVRLRESVTKLEARLQRAQAAGDDALVEQTQASLATQREWLAQAESSLDSAR